LSVSSSIHALDITKLLGDKPDYATFSKYLTETKLVDQINSQKTITVLVVNNAALSALSGKSPQVIKAILSTHVILEFVDEKKLMQDIIGPGKLMTTLYQSSGQAVNQQGFIKAALIGEGSIAFGSAVSGAPAPDAEIVQSVVSQPDISVIEISKLIVVPGIDSQTPASPSNGQAPAAAKTKPEGATAPVASTKAPTASAKAPAASAKAPVPTEGAKSAAPTEGAKAPVSNEDAKAPTQSAEAPTHDAKADAPTTGAQTPSSEEVTAPSPSEVVTDSPAVTPTTEAAGPGGEAAADATTPSSSSRTIVGLVGAVMCFASLLVVM
ncbi:fasciclin-like arabinogalactan protein 3-like, partial [Trifolium medium]|nr:fasciclin-like arabinogalactan protein 3-like [Trifolium medium]